MAVSSLSAELSFYRCRPHLTALSAAHSISTTPQFWCSLFTLLITFSLAVAGRVLSINCMGMDHESISVILKTPIQATVLASHTLLL
jgi:hypothetical protein